MFIKLPWPYDEPGSSLFTLTYDATSAYSALSRFQFGYKPPGPYVRLALDRPWTSKVKRGPTSIPALFKDQMAANLKLRLCVFSGYFDTTGPYTRPVADFNAAGLLKNSSSYQLFESGHAVFSDDVVRKIACDRLLGFYGA